MEDMTKNRLTREGMQQFEEELEFLKTSKRSEIAEKIKEARAQGDLSENAEYDAAKNEQRDVEARIEQLENILKNAEVIDDDDVTTDRVGVGCIVTVNNITTDKKSVYSVVGTTEANSLEGKISDSSPLGRALVGRKKGETVTVNAPAGEFQYKIVKIEKRKKK